MVSDRLNTLVRDRIQRTYLSGDDGYWADVVLAEFAFLEDLGGRVDDIAFHQKGDYIRYIGPWGEVVLEFAPDNYPRGWVFGRADVRSDTTRFKGDLRALAGGCSVAQPEPGNPRDREGITAMMHTWATALRRTAGLFDETPDGAVDA